MTADYEFVKSVVDGNDWDTVRKDAARVRELLTGQLLFTLPKEDFQAVQSLMQLAEETSSLVKELYGE